MPIITICNLCNSRCKLKKSHIFPKGIYKRFVGDQSKSGAFLNLRDGRVNNLQFTRHWFCDDCEHRLQRGEDVYYKLVDNKPFPQIYSYDKWLYYFAVSISWRCALFYFENAQGSTYVQPALDCWRMYLLSETPIPEPYSQYMVSIASPKWKPWNQSLGGFAMPNLHLSLSVVGPLIIIGTTQPQEFSSADSKVLESAQLLPSGGNILFHDATIESICAVNHVATAIRFWQSVSENLIGRIER
jgi:hypothetical protein